MKNVTHVELKPISIGPLTYLFFYLIINTLCITSIFCKPSNILHVANWFSWAHEELKRREKKTHTNIRIVSFWRTLLLLLLLLMTFHVYRDAKETHIRTNIQRIHMHTSKHFQTHWQPWIGQYEPSDTERAHIHICTLESSEWASEWASEHTTSWRCADISTTTWWFKLGFYGRCCSYCYCCCLLDLFFSCKSDNIHTHTRPYVRTAHTYTSESSAHISIINRNKRHGAA